MAIKLTQYWKISSDKLFLTWKIKIFMYCRLYLVNMIFDTLRHVISKFATIYHWVGSVPFSPQSTVSWKAVNFKFLGTGHIESCFLDILSSINKTISLALFPRVDQDIYKKDNYENINKQVDKSFQILNSLFLKGYLTKRI